MGHRDKWLFLTYAYHIFLIAWGPDLKSMLGKHVFSQETNSNSMSQFVAHFHISA